MFELGELYAAWTESPANFWANEEGDSVAYQDMLTLEPESILDEDTWDQVLAYACPAPDGSAEEAAAWLAIVVNGLKVWSQRVAQNSADPQEFAACREALEKYLFLTRLHLARLDELISAIEPATTTTRSRKTTLGTTGEQARELLDAISRTIQTGVSAVFPATETAKRASLALLYLEPSCRLLQHEIVVKDAQLVRELVRLLSLSVKLQHQQSMVRTQILQLLTYYEHAVPVTVQLLDVLQKQFDHTALAEHVLKDLATEALSWTDSQNSATTNRAKCVNAFLQLLTQSMPALVANNLSSVSMLIGSPIPQLRQAVLDIATPMIQNILAPEGGQNGDEDDPTVPTTSLSGLELGGSGGGGQFGGATAAGGNAAAVGNNSNTGSGNEAGPTRYKPAFDLIQLVEARVNDVSHFCRLRAVQVLASVVREPYFISRRDKFTEIAISKMKDRTQLVRRQAMRLMKQLIDSHPQVMHANCLSRPVWESSLREIENQVEEMEPSETKQQLEAAHAFVTFTLKFIARTDEAIAVAQTLLLSRSKSDILDAIDLLVYADAYGIESSAQGIRSIVHLVWAKADNDEGNSVRKAAVSTYKDLFMTAPPELDTRRGAQLIAENLISLTRGSTQGELTSLEQLLIHAMEEDWVSVAVVSRLWGIYQTQLKIDPAQRRGAAIILSMLATADKSVACSGVSAVVDIGLSTLGEEDPELAAYSFAILKRSITPDAESQRLPANYELFDKLIRFVLLPARETKSMQWTFMAKEALAAISEMCECPPKVYTRLVSEYISQVFGKNMSKFTNAERMQLFAQLLYIVGEVALNLLVYLERSELRFKQRLQSKQQPGGEQQQQQQQQPQSQQQAADEEEELMASGGSREDDFQDVLKDIREEGILYSDKALLKPFVGVVTEICRQELAKSEYQQQQVQQQAQEQEAEEQADFAKPAGAPQNALLVMGATQTLSKLMCVSSHFCEDNLPLLVDLMSKHESNVVRSNFVVALGDVAICFNRLIDDHTEYLYDRLNDRDPIVQRTCIVALTFLILAGQIKVKGKLGEMAKAVAHPNRKISSLATMFFRELASKENAIYNSFLDMLSTLIADEQLPESDMLSILKFLAEFIDRERQMKQLTDKLVARLPRCESSRQWNAYVQILKHLPRKLDDAIKEKIALGFDRMPDQEENSMTDQQFNDQERQQEVEQAEQQARLSANASANTSVIGNTSAMEVA